MSVHSGTRVPNHRRFSQVPMPRRSRKLVDRVLLAYVKFPIPKPCYNGRKMARFWSFVIARSDCIRKDTYSSRIHIQRGQKQNTYIQRGYIFEKDTHSGRVRIRGDTYSRRIHIQIESIYKTVAYSDRMHIREVYSTY